MRILLVRHGLSTANVDPKVHHQLPDHAIPLAPAGIEQAERAREELIKYFSKNITQVYDDDGSYSSLWSKRHKSDEIILWQSPYKRTRETAAIISEGQVVGFEYQFTQSGRKKETVTYPLCSSIKENISLCEQKFGLFDGLSDDELKERFPKEHQHYKLAEDFGGRFWAQMPMGESRFDVAVRVHQIFGTWKRDEEKHGIDTVIVVSHGVTIRAIIMRWLDLPFEWFEKEPNPGNCSIRLLDGCKDMGYIFQGYGRDGKLL